MPEFNNPDKPISEQFRLVAKKYAELNKASQMLEESKTSILSQMIQDVILNSDDKIAHNQAEREVKASLEWRDYLKKMVDAKYETNLAKLQVEHIRMRFTEWQMQTASARDERKMMRVHP